MEFFFKKSTKEPSEPKADNEQKDQNVFSVDRFALNSLVTVMIGLKEVMSKTLKALERAKERLTDIVCEMGKMADCLNRSRKAIEEKEKQDHHREERRLNRERRQEEEKREEREEKWKKG